MSSFWTAQLIGVCAIAVALWVYQVNKRSSMLLLNGFADVLFALQFIFLNAYTGAAMNVVAAGRNFAFYRTKPSHRNSWVLFCFMFAACLATVLTWQGPISVLPLCANWLNAAATWQVHTTRLRRIAVFAPPFWIVYSLLVHSYPGLFIESFILCSNLLGQYRFDMRPSLPGKKISEPRLP